MQRQCGDIGRLSEFTETADLLLAFEATRQRQNTAIKSLCNAPFVALTLSPDGNASACCFSRSHSLGNVRQHRLDEIWQGEPIRQFRAMLRNYAFPSGCEYCEWSLIAGNFRTHPTLSFDHLPIHDDVQWPSKIEFAMSNTCNLACVMCTGEYSSVIRANEGLPPMPAAYDEQFFEDLARYLPHVQELSFLGGEPFLQQECFRVWDMMIERELSPICHVTTNGSLFDARVERVLQNLPMNLSVSIDGITKTTIESIRVNSTYENLMKNLHRFNCYAHGDTDRYPSKRMRHLQLNYCVMQQNWQELPDFFRFAESVGARVATVLVTHPRHCSLFALPQENLRAVVATLEDQTPALSRELNRNRTSWLELLKEMGNHSTEQPTVMPAFGEVVRRNRAVTRDGSVGAMERAWVLMRQGKQEEALEAALHTLPTDPNYYKALVLIAEIRIAMQDYQRAEQALLRAVNLSPKHPEAYMRRAWLRYYQGRLADGLAELALSEERAGKLERVEDFILEQSLLVGAVLYFHTGHANQALEKIEGYLALQPDDGRARKLREDCLTGLDQRPPEASLPVGPTIIASPSPRYTP
jgi:radical SAM protein with 4Fe4S-binding SPASM domain